MSEDRYAEARALVIGSNKASCSFIQRKLYMGWNEAARYVERLEAEGYVGPPDHAGRREVLRNMVGADGKAKTEPPYLILAEPPNGSPALSGEGGEPFPPHIAHPSVGAACIRDCPGCVAWAERLKSLDPDYVSKAALVTPPSGEGLREAVTDAFNEVFCEHGPSGYGRDTPAQIAVGNILNDLQAKVLAALKQVDAL